MAGPLLTASGVIMRMMVMIVPQYIKEHTVHLCMLMGRLILVLKVSLMAEQWSITDPGEPSHIPIAEVTAGSDQRLAGNISCLLYE